MYCNKVFLFSSSHGKQRSRLDKLKYVGIMFVCIISSQIELLQLIFPKLWQVCTCLDETRQRVSFILHDLKLKCYCVLNEPLTSNGIVTEGTPVRNVVARCRHGQTAINGLLFCLTSVPACDSCCLSCCHRSLL